MTGLSRPTLWRPRVFTRHPASGPAVSYGQDGPEPPARGGSLTLSHRGADAARERPPVYCGPAHRRAPGPRPSASCSCRCRTPSGYDCSRPRWSSTTATPSAPPTAGSGRWSRRPRAGLSRAPGRSTTRWGLGEPRRPPCWIVGLDLWNHSLACGEVSLGALSHQVDQVSERLRPARRPAGSDQAEPLKLACPSRPTPGHAQSLCGTVGWSKMSALRG